MLFKTIILLKILSTVFFMEYDRIDVCLVMPSVPGIPEDCFSPLPLAFFLYIDMSLWLALIGTHFKIYIDSYKDIPEFLLDLFSVVSSDILSFLFFTVLSYSYYISFIFVMGDVPGINSVDPSTIVDATVALDHYTADCNNLSDVLAKASKEEVTNKFLEDTSREQIRKDQYLLTSFFIISLSLYFISAHGI